jgi:cellulose synthase/poly-beta-1,6-N-acetylglucosamine synthase-like glycosyltransferase
MSCSPVSNVAAQVAHALSCATWAAFSSTSASVSMDSVPPTDAPLLSSMSFVYPMFNEKDNIETAVRESLRIGRRLAREVEIVIVNDASTDGSAEIADCLSREHPEVRVIHHEQNRKALKTALRLHGRIGFFYWAF